MNAMPGERAMSFSPDLCFMCSAEKFPSIMNVRTSSFLSIQRSKRSLISQIMTYGLYLTVQSSGRFIPGCGHAGQNIAIAPSAAEHSD